MISSAVNTLIALNTDSDIIGSTNYLPAVSNLSSTLLSDILAEMFIDDHYNNMTLDDQYTGKADSFEQHHIAGTSTANDIGVNITVE